MAKFSSDVSQPNPPLTTKLYIPPTRPDVVSRPRLIERLNQGLDCKLTLVSAPAGFGKTTLVGEWLSGLERPSAWLSLDEGDNDLARFLSYVIAALQHIDPSLGQTTQALLQTPQPLGVEPLLTPVINEIAALNTSFAFVLDDYHAITLPAIHEAVTFLLEHMPLPPGMHLLIATREDLPLSLARLRAERQMTEIRAGDLRFTEEEATAFLNQTMGLSLTPEAIRALEIRTEGWIVGLQLAALSLQAELPERIPGFIQAFTGSHRYVVDYLTEEVLRRRPPGTRSFLLRTSILERLTGPLCDAVCDAACEGDGQATLERLEEANLFLIPLDSERRWYRYHHLFADLLRNQLKATQPDLVPTLHRRASEWYEEKGLIPEAVDHALAAEDLEGAARLIEQIGFSLLTRSEFATVSRWLEAMPEEFVRSRPWLCIFQAWMLRRAGRLDAVEQLVGDAERALKAASTPVASETEVQAIRANMAILRAYVAIFNGEISRAIELSHQALEYFPPDHIIRGVTSVTLGLAYRMKGDLVRAVQAFAEARSTSQKMGNIFLTHIATWHMGYTLMLQGQLRQAVNTYRDSLELASEQGKRRILFAGQPHIYIGSILREWNELEAAETHLMEGIELCEPTRLLDALTDGYLAMARVRLALRDLNGALDACQDARQTLQVPNPDPVSLIRADDCRVQLWLAQGKYQEAARWAEESGLRVDDELSYIRELEHISLARVLVALGRDQPGGWHIDDALKLLARLLDAAETGGWVGKVVEILVLQALAFQIKSEEEKALAALEKVLSLAEPEGYVRLFVDEGEPMAALLRKAASRGIAPDYISKLLAAFKTETNDQRRTTETSPSSFAARRGPSSPALSEAEGLVEPLSNRELEVLRLLNTDLSAPEIAVELVVSVNTVRTHIKRIYSKLDAHSRYEAVQRAKELDLL